MDIFKTNTDSYDEYYERSREAYVMFVNFAPTVQASMLEVDKWHQQYEMQRLQCLEDFDEIEKLSTWYEYFHKSYIEMESELERRRAYDAEMEAKSERMRQYLRSEMEKEQLTRLDFNDKHYRYLPQNLKVLLEEPPTRYDIYPKKLFTIDQSKTSE